MLLQEVRDLKKGRPKGKGKEPHMELKKSYKGFVFWMIGYVLVMLAMAFLPVDAELAMPQCVHHGGGTVNLYYL